MDKILSSLGELALLALMFAIAAGVGLVGVALRRAYEYARHGYPGKAALFGVLGLGGLLVVLGVGLLFYARAVSTICLATYGVVMVVLLILGWSGRIIAPEGLADDDDKD